LIIGFQLRIPLATITRDISIPLNSGKIISICGVRRSGKTFMLYESINQLINLNITKPQNILFISFDNERIYFFFDEIQMADGWEQFIRRIYDQFSKNIFISGSNSRLLATEIASSLRGRTIQIEIFPLSFKEYCRFKKYDTNYYSNENKAILINGFYQFLSKGSFPELVLNDFLYFEKILQEYYHVMLYKDVIERYSVRNIPVLKYLVSRMLANLGKPTSIHRIYNEIKSAGLKTDKNLLYDLAEQVESVYLTYRLPKYSNSLLKTELAADTLKREIDGLIEASQVLQCNNAIILTPEREDEIHSGCMKINIQAAWKEMLK